MMKKILICILTFMAILPAIYAQEDLLARIREANMPSSLKASWHQVKQSPLLADKLESSGKLWLQSPDKIRWEMTSPHRKVSILDGENGRGRFKLPSERDFKASVLESDIYTVTLVPLRRDLKQLFRQILLKVDKETLMVRSILLTSGEGEWTLIEFSNLEPGASLSADLFEKE